MRAIWKGAVSFGLVSVPVKLYSATESHDVSFRQVHAKDGGRIKYQRVCSLDGEEVAYADIAKGYETEDGEMVILTVEGADPLVLDPAAVLGVDLAERHVVALGRGVELHRDTDQAEGDGTLPDRAHASTIAVTSDARLPAKGCRRGARLHPCAPCSPARPTACRAARSGCTR